MSAPVLDIQGLNVSYTTGQGRLRVLRDIDLAVAPDRILGIVGESGCGKSTLIAAILSLLAENAVVESGAIRLDGRDLLGLSPRELRALRGPGVAAVFQDPMTSLNPVMSIATQMIDIQWRDRLPRSRKRERAVAMLREVGLADPERRIDEHPHRLSGGMRQRVAIAMALLMHPMLLIADEPTTALDVSMEAQIARLFLTLRRNIPGAIVFVSHNLGLIAELCDEVVVMYAGEIVESCNVQTLFARPRHPYTRLLLACDPGRLEATGQPIQAPLPTIPGTLPDLADLPSGCVFAPRCPDVIAACGIGPVGLTRPEPGHAVRCLRA